MASSSVALLKTCCIRPLFWRQSRRLQRKLRQAGDGNSRRRSYRCFGKDGYIRPDRARPRNFGSHVSARGTDGKYNRRSHTGAIEAPVRTNALAISVPSVSSASVTRCARGARSCTRSKSLSKPDESFFRSNGRVTSRAASWRAGRFLLSAASINDTVYCVSTVRSSKPRCAARLRNPSVASLPFRAAPSQTITASSRRFTARRRSLPSAWASAMMTSFAAA